MESIFSDRDNGRAYRAESVGLVYPGYREKAGKEGTSPNGATLCAALVTRKSCMRRKRYLYILLILFAALGGCGNSPTSSRVFTDSLTLGIGKRGIDLTGETTVFTGALVTVYWRVESREKLMGAEVEFVVEKKNGPEYEAVFRTLYQPESLDDHVVISSYFNTFGTGMFRATGYIGYEKRVVGPKEFVVREAGSQ